MSKGLAISAGPSQNEKRSDEFGSRSVAEAFPITWPVPRAGLPAVIRSSSLSSLTTLDRLRYTRLAELLRPPHPCLERLHRHKSVLHRLLGKIDGIQVCVPTDVLAVGRCLALGDERG